MGNRQTMAGPEMNNFLPPTRTSFGNEQQQQIYHAAPAASQTAFGHSLPPVSNFLSLPTVVFLDRSSGSLNQHWILQHY